MLRGLVTSRLISSWDSRPRGDLDALRQVGRHVARRHVDDAVRVEGEGDSICGTPRGAGGTPPARNGRATCLGGDLALPWSTCTSTVSWLSTTVVKIWVFFVGWSNCGRSDG